MPKERACANDAFRLPVPHSEENPYHMAIYLHALTQLVDHLSDQFDSAPKGFGALISIMEERAYALAMTLDAPAFCGDWPELEKRLNNSGSLAIATAPDSEHTEILRLFQEHEKITQAARAHVYTTTDQDKELEQLFNQDADRIENTIMALPSTCAADLAAKMIVAHCDGYASPPHDHPVWIEARLLTRPQE